MPLDMGFQVYVLLMYVSALPWGARYFMNLSKVARAVLGVGDNERMPELPVETLLSIVCSVAHPRDVEERVAEIGVADAPASIQGSTPGSKVYVYVDREGREFRFLGGHEKAKQRAEELGVPGDIFVEAWLARYGEGE